MPRKSLEDEQYTTLPELVVTPAPWQIDFKNNFGDNEINNAIINGIKQAIEDDDEDYVEKDSYNILNRLYNVWNNAGRPKIRRDNPILNSIIYKDRANYFPGYGISLPIKGYKQQDYGNTRDFNYVVLDDFISEIAHPIQLKQGNNRNYIRNFLYNSFNDIIGSRKQYDDKDNYEYETHSVIQPELEDYIYNNKSTKYIRKSLKN